MGYQFHINIPARKITIHHTDCNHWKKHVGTAFHKHGFRNSFYLEDDNLQIEGYSIGRHVGMTIAKAQRLQYHECLLCKPHLQP